jgi:hypothetical protein
VPAQSREKRQGSGTPIEQISFDPEYTPGARNAVQVCLRVEPEEKVCLITDDARDCGGDRA